MHYESALGTISAGGGQAHFQEQSALQRKVGITFERQGNYDAGLMCLAAAQTAIANAPQPMPVEQARILNEAGWIHFQRGELAEAEKLLMQGLRLVEGTPNYDIMAALYNRLGGVYFQKGELEQAAYFVHKSLTQREAIGDVIGVARLQNNLGLLRWRQGDYDSALSSFQQALKLLAQIGDIEALAFTYTNLGLLRTDRGELEQARDELRNSLEAALRIGHPLEIARARVHFARVHLYLGDTAQALSDLEDGLRIFRELHSQENLIEVCHLLGECWAEMGDLNQAEDWGQQGLELVAGEGEAALDHSAEYGRILRLLGKIARQRGDLEKAGQHLRKSLAIFQVLQDRLELGKAHYQLALLALSERDPASARAQLQEAFTIFEKLGSKLELRRVKEALAQLKGQ
jgi:tetratricopeptide (TPR) repeat protein